MWVKKRTEDEIKVDLTPVVGGVRDSENYNFYVRLVRRQSGRDVFAVRRHHLPHGFLPRCLPQHGELGVRSELVDDYLHALRRVCRGAAARALQFRRLAQPSRELPFLHRSVRVLGANTVRFKLACLDGVTPLAVCFTLGYSWPAERPSRFALSCADARPEFLESLREAALDVFQKMPLWNAIEEIAGCNQST
ncbi:uncharacterized protein LOC134543127 [Bacillus rossius redtenbacheri]|uniref:uncharacterized protein LOC134543127 n=1 Tax=Bacillus rossius redtenbacheri TaxID=93214 RepID=UPI002FDE682D